MPVATTRIESGASQQAELVDFDVINLFLFKIPVFQEVSFDAPDIQPRDESSEADFDEFIP